MAPQAKDQPSLPAIQWAANDHALTWSLLKEIGEFDNFRVLFGKTDPKDNTSKDTKIAVCKKIGEALFPHLFPQYATTVGERVRSKITDLVKQYIFHAKRLRQTGGGLQGNSEDSQMASESQESDGNQYLDFYIPPDGPDHDTSPVAQNLWDQIMKDFPFFASLHSVLASRPSAVPPAITTGTGPAGRQTLYLQPPTQPPSTQGSDQAEDGGLLAPELPATRATSTEDLSSQPLTAAAPVASSRSFGTPVTTNQLNSAPRRGPRASTLSQTVLDNAKARIAKLPPKRSFEDTIIALQEKSIDAAAFREAEERAFKKRRLLMEEYKCGIWTVDEYLDSQHR